MVYIVCIAVLFMLTAWVGLRNTPIILRNSLSIHVGKSRQSIAVARVCFPVISILLLAWFLMQYTVKQPMLIDILLGVILFAATIAIQGIFPYGHRDKWDRIHDVAAWTAACIGPALLLRFAWVSHGPTQLLLFVCGLLSVSILSVLVLVPSVRKYFLILQLSIVMISGASFLILSL